MVVQWTVSAISAWVTQVVWQELRLAQGLNTSIGQFVWHQCGLDSFTQIGLGRNRGEATELFDPDRPLISVLFGLCIGVLSAVMSVHVCAWCHWKLWNQSYIQMVLRHHVVLGIEPRSYGRIALVLTNRMICSSSKLFLFLFQSLIHLIACSLMSETSL